MDWYQISVVGSEQASESLGDVFTSIGAVSVTFQDAADQPLYEPPPDAHPLWQKTRIVALFENPVDLVEVREVVARSVPSILLSDWKMETLVDRAWEREWMDHFKPMQFGERLWICPSHATPPDPDAVNLLLDPGLAFGTGTHPTTALCLEWLATSDVRGLHVIDYGCGSGVLAVASILLGASRATAVDIDPQALIATEENARKNGVADRIHCCLPVHLGDEKADVVLANILAKPLEELAPVLIECLEPCGRLVLSGLLREQIDTVLHAYSADVDFAPPMIRENWARLDGIRHRKII